MRVLVVNAGSSSLKLTLVVDGAPEDAETVDRWEGEDDLAALDSFVNRVGAVEAVGHRVVHGGSRREAARVDEPLLADLAGLSDLAPLHNARAVAGMRLTGRLLDVPEVACFDTTFHAELPAAAATYALPREWNERWSLRRYGFHGLSHAYAVRRAAELVGRPVEELRMVTCHLGAGASLAAVVAGVSVDTTMGLTPLEGLVMATRSGSVDPGLLVHLLRQGVSVEELADGLEHRSGLAGLAQDGQGTGDLRDVLSLRAAGDADATLAYDVYVHRLVREVGAMTASAQGLDVLVLTGGVGEHAATLRADLATRLAHLGVDVDARANDVADGDADLTASGAAARTVVVTAREEVEVARQVESCLAG